MLIFPFMKGDLVTITDDPYNTQGGPWMVMRGGQVYCKLRPYRGAGYNKIAGYTKTVATSKLERYEEKI